MTRQDELLLLIEEHCTSDGRYFMPEVDPMYCYRLGRTLDVHGAGDARSLKALERRGLIRPRGFTDYSYEITEEGKLRAQTIA